MATLDDIKKILEQMAAQGAATAAKAAPDPAKQRDAVIAAAERVKLAQEERDAYDKMSFIRSGIFENEEKSKLLREAEVELQKAEIELLEKKAKATTHYNQHQIAHFKQRTEDAKKEAAEANRQRASKERQKAAQKEIVAATKQYISQNVQVLKQSASIGLNQSAIGRSIGGAASSAAGMVGSFATLVTSAVSFGASLAAAGVSMTVIAAVVIPLALAFVALSGALLIVGASVAVTSYFIQLAVDARDAAASFVMTTGATMELGKEVVKLHERNVMAGVSLEDANKAMSALYKNTTIFSRALPSQMGRMGDFVAILEKWGVSAQTSAKAMEISVVALGISIDKVGDTMSQLAEHAKYLSVDVAMYMEQFAGMGGELAVYDDAVGTFKDLARAQKITGMEMRKIIDLARKFDTFEGAAKMAGNLNAALGGNFVNAMDMMTETDPVARFEMIRDALKDGGVEFENMGYYAKRFYMEQLGLKDVSELAVLMRGDLNDLTGDYGKSADELMAARQRTREYQGTLETLKNLLMTLKPVFVGLIDPIQDMVKSLVGPDGPTKQFLDIRNSIQTVVKDGILPLILAVPGMLASFTLWTEQNQDLIQTFIDLIPTMIEVAIMVTKFLAFFGGEQIASVGAVSSAVKGDREQAEKEIELSNKMWGSHDSFMGKIYQSMTWRWQGVKGLGTSALAWLLEDEAKAVTKLNKAYNTPGSPTFNESLKLQNDMYSQMPSNIDKASRAMSSMKSPISSAAVEMNKLGESTAATVDEAKKLFTPGTFKATGTVGFQEVMTGRASAGVTGPAATSTAAQNAPPIVKQPVEFVVTLDGRAVGNFAMDVIGREIQAVIS